MLQAEHHRHPGQDLPGLEGRQEEFVRSHLQDPGRGCVGELSQGHDNGQVPGGVVGLESANERLRYARPLR